METKAKFIRIGKANGGVFQYRRILKDGKHGPKLWACDYRDERGKKARKMGFETKADAVNFGNEHASRDGAILSPEKMTFSTVLAEYRVDRQRNGKRDLSYYHLSRFVPALGDIPIRKITSARFEAALEGIVKEYGLGLSTRNRALAMASGMFTFAMKKRWIRDHPIRFGRVERYKEMGARERWLRPNEIKALAEKAIELGYPWMAPIIEFAAATGKRRGEIQNMRRADQRTDANGEPCIYIGRTKNGTAETFPLTGAALEIVKRQTARCTSPSSFLFPGAGGVSAHKGITRYFGEVVVAVAKDHPDWNLVTGRGKDGVTFHTLRHSFATIGHAAGMTEKMLMQTGNWRSRNMIDRYVHTDSAALRTMIGRVGELVVGKFSGEGKKSGAAG